MPSNLLNADTGFPNFTEDMTNDQKISKVMNYLYMLLEQLRYTLSNLGVDNFNDAELVELAKIITDPVYIRLEDEMGSVTSLQITVEGLTSRVSNSEGDITVLQQTADSLSTRVTNAEGNISQVTQTADGLVSRVSTAEGNISTLTQTASGLSSRVSNAEGDISVLTQTANGLSSRVSNAEGDISTLTQTANRLSSRLSNAEGEVSEIWQEIDGIGLVISDGELNTASIVAAINDSGSSVMISADKITMDGDVVFLTSEDVGDYGSTEISGSRVTMTMDGSDDNGRNNITSNNGLEFIYLTEDGDREQLATIYNSAEGSDTDETSRYALNIVAPAFNASTGDRVYPAIKLNAAGRVSLEGELGVYIGAYASEGFITLDAGDNVRIYPAKDYSDMYIDGYYAYCFCTDGIYYRGTKILDV